MYFITFEVAPLCTDSLSLAKYLIPLSQQNLQSLAPSVPSVFPSNLTYTCDCILHSQPERVPFLCDKEITWFVCC